MKHADAALVRTSLSGIYEKRSEFAAKFYDRFFVEIPSARRLFVHDLKKQEMMLFSVVAMTTRGLERGRDLDEELHHFGRGHAHIGVEESYFPVFGSVFLDTMYEFLPYCDRAALAQSWWGVFTMISEGIIEGMRSERAEMAEDRKLFSPTVVNLTRARAAMGQ